MEDLWLGLKKACRKATLKDVNLAHLPPYVRVQAQCERHGPSDGEGTLGHSDIKTTMRYAHANREAKMNAVRRIGSVSDKVVTIPDSEKTRHIGSRCKTMGYQVL
jgi:hypothetical protein